MLPADPSSLPETTSATRDAALSNAANHQASNVPAVVLDAVNDAAPFGPADTSDQAASAPAFAAAPDFPHGHRTTADHNGHRTSADDNGHRTSAEQDGSQTAAASISAKPQEAPVSTETLPTANVPTEAVSPETVSIGTVSIETAPAETLPADATTENTVIVEAPAEKAEKAEKDGFGALGLPRKLVRALAAQDITSPFPIQVATVPDALNGRDVLGRGQTGSGKTLAFGLPMLARLAISGRSAPRHPKALVLVPTRELAMQVNDALAPLAKSLGLYVRTAVGGVPYDRQTYALDRGVDVLVATPGRLGDLIKRGTCVLDAVETTVLDEADQMADMGFLPEVTELLRQTPEGSQRLLFSATLDKDVDALVRRFLTDPVTHSIGPSVLSVEAMDHHILLIPPNDKFAVAASITARPGRTIVFVKTQAAVDELVGQLAAVGVRAGALHGGKTQRVRTKTLAEFRDGTVDVLVATDVAARGIHVDGVSLVLHMDLPRDQKDYLHRAGRTARAGATGTVITLVLPRQRRRATQLLQKAGVTPHELRVRAGDPVLAEVTGAREPSGVPVRIAPEAPARRFDDRSDRRPSSGRSFTGRPRPRPDSDGRSRPAWHDGESRPRPWLDSENRSQTSPAASGDAGRPWRDGDSSRPRREGDTARSAGRPRRDGDLAGPGAARTLRESDVKSRPWHERGPRHEGDAKVSESRRPPHRRPA